MIVNNLLVSIITPAYNCEDYIVDTIKSAQAQTYAQWEMIIVDDLSTDNTTAVVKEIMKTDDRVSLICLEKNQGAAVARNTAIEAAQGEYIAFLDSDDKWLPEKLEKQVHFMKHNNVMLSYSDYNVIDENDELLSTFKSPAQLTYHDLLKSCSIGCLTAMYDAKALGKVYMPIVRKRQDFALWLKILKKIDHAQGFNEVLAEYRVRNNSISANKFDAAKYQWRIYREVEGLNIFQSVYYFINYAYYGVKKYK